MPSQPGSAALRRSKNRNQKAHDGAWSPDCQATITHAAQFEPNNAEVSIGSYVALGLGPATPLLLVPAVLAAAAPLPQVPPPLHSWSPPGLLSNSLFTCSRIFF